MRHCSGTSRPGWSPLARTRRSTKSGRAEPTPDAATEPTPDAATPKAPPARPARRRAARKPAAAAATGSETPAPATDPTPSDPAPARSRRRILVTGGTGFVGGRIVERLLARGDEVVAAVRDPGRAGNLADLGAEVLANDLSDVARLAEDMHDIDGAVHAAGSYRIGITRDERGEMWDANVGATTRFLDAAEVARVPRIVYVSTVNVFGNTRGRVVDETYRRDLREGFLSWYDETKYGAHEVAQQRASAGAPIVIVLPSQVYGPGDPSGFGDLLRRAHAGRLRYRAVDEAGVGLVHVEDLATGIVAALDRGRAGESYVLSGPNTTLGEALGVAAAIGGQRLPRLRLPTAAIRAFAPLGRFVGQPNVREVIGATAGVTYCASSDKAAQDLDFRTRDLETGLRDTFGGL
ncbi:MAG TPA: NAD-dependent epimerase/dehydratase family protein [Vitreimonas sp.]|nr:NAD-dependent epimerase/dehydratase family protein [Vitreimonas sp.]